MIAVGNNMIVSMRYIMKDRNDEILENTLHAAPVSYLHGAGKILPSLQLQLDGMSKGQTRIIELSDQQLPYYLFYVVIDEVREATQEEMLLGYPLPQKITDCGEDCGCHRNE